MIWIASSLLIVAILVAWNTVALRQLERQIKRLTWFHQNPDNQPKIRWPPSTGWNGLTDDDLNSRD